MVAKELLKEFPQQLANLVTLSPIPGFRKWLDTHLKIHAENGMIDTLTIYHYDSGCSSPTEEGCLINEAELKPVTEYYSEQNSNHLSILRDVLNSREWVVERDSSLTQALRSPLMSLCARSVVASMLHIVGHTCFSSMFTCKVHVNNI